MSVATNAKKQITPEFAHELAKRVEVRERRSLLSMDFPTIDELEMDVPILNAHMSQHRLAPEDDGDLEMQYMLHFDPSRTLHLAR